MSITDEHGRPVSSGSNGKSETTEVAGIRKESVDVRSIPTGTLMWNLYLASNAEHALLSQIRQLQILKEAQKMVEDPPQMQKMIQDFHEAEQGRYTIAKELNARFHDRDMSRCSGLGIELYEPAQEEAGASDE